MKHLWLTLLFLLALALPASAQSSAATSFQIRYFNVGAPAPLQQSDTFLAQSISCNQTPPPPTQSTVNPTRAVWDDPDRTGRVCVYVAPSGSALLSFPVGAYEGSLVAINESGQSESARAPFSRVAPPAVKTGFRFVQ